MSATDDWFASITYSDDAAGAAVREHNDAIQALDAAEDSGASSSVTASLAAVVDTTFRNLYPPVQDAFVAQVNGQERTEQTALRQVTRIDIRDTPVKQNIAPDWTPAPAPVDPRPAQYPPVEKQSVLPLAAIAAA